MGLLFYKLTLFAYLFAIKIASGYTNKARLFLKGRKNLFSDLSDHFKGYSGKTAWFHAASLGEFEQTRPALEKFKDLFPTYKILLTFFSPSGYEVRKNYPSADFVCYLPFDSKKNARKFINIVNPSIAFFAKYEFWYYFSKEIKSGEIPLISFSSIFRKNQLFFKFYGGFYRKTLFNFTQFFVQNQESKNLLNSISINNVEISGDTRFDRVVQLTEPVDKISEFKKNRELMVIGSAWEEDLKVIAPFINSSEDSMCFIIAPHEIHEPFLVEIEKKLTRKTSRYSHYITEAETDVLLLDNVGILAGVYQYADYAFIGGAYKDGLHNVLEAAVYGMPIIHGNKKFKKFQEAVDLKELGVSFPVADNSEFNDVMAPIRKGSVNYQHIKQKSIDYVHEKSGGTEKIMAFVTKLIEE